MDSSFEGPLENKYTEVPARSLESQTPLQQPGLQRAALENGLQSENDTAFGRRTFVGRAIGNVLAASGIIAAADAIVEAHETNEFISHAPEYSNSLVVTEPIYYGDMAAPARAGFGYQQVALGDSIEWGYTNGHQVSMPRMLEDDMNRTLAASGVPPLNPEGIYWFTFMMARPGATTRQIAKQAANLSEVMRRTTKYIGPWEIEVSMGGNDALNYFSDHMTPFKIRSIIADFPAFLEGFKRRSELVIATLANMRHVENLSGLERIVVNGIPDIGRSQEIWIMNVPGIGSFFRRVGTAACKYMNQTLVKAIEDAREKTGMKIYLDDMFDLPVSDVHPLGRGYHKAVHRKELRRFGGFPDAKRPRSFREEADEHGILDIPPRPQPTQTLNA